MKIKSRCLLLSSLAGLAVVARAEPFRYVDPGEIRKLNASVPDVRGARVANPQDSPTLEGSPEMLELARKALAMQGLGLNDAGIKILVALFEEGTTPTRQDVLGLHAGYSFDKDGGKSRELLVSQQLREDPSGPVIAIDRVSYGIEPADMDSVPPWRASLIRSRVDWDAVSIPDFRPKEIYFVTAPWLIISDCKIRKFGDYLVAQRVDERYGGKPEDMRVYYSYYFKDVTPPAEKLQHGRSR